MNFLGCSKTQDKGQKQTRAATREGGPHQTFFPSAANAFFAHVKVQVSHESWGIFSLPKLNAVLFNEGQQNQADAGRHQDRT